MYPLNMRHWGGVREDVKRTIKIFVYISIEMILKPHTTSNMIKFKIHGYVTNFGT
jgi:hypothetical protein